MALRQRGLLHRRARVDSHASSIRRSILAMSELSLYPETLPVKSTLLLELPLPSKVSGEWRTETSTLG